MTTNPFAPDSKPATTTPGSPGSPSFRTGEASLFPDSTNGQPGAIPAAPGAAPGAASNFGTEQTGAGVTRTPPATFTVPGLYGRNPQQFVVGEGRLARPRFRFNGKISTGYDDNVFQTPTHPQTQRPQKIPILVTPGNTETTALVTVPSGDPLVPDSEELVQIPAQAPKFRYQKIPGTTAPERIGSFVTRSSVGWDVQLASRRNLFTFDINAGNSYYWDRPGKKSEYTGSLALIYLRKITGRAQFTLAFNASYQSQPDFSQVNSPTNNNRGSYLTTNAKADLSYRLTPRFSTVTSVAYNSLYSMEKSQSSGDFGETTFGTELRYLFSPRITLLGELRYSSSAHKDNVDLDTNTYFLLLGGELTLTRRFTASIRIGESMQTYSESGQKSSSPYVETSLDYRLARGTTIEWNGRFGYEESGIANGENIVARSGLTLTHIFSPRLQASASVNLVHTQMTSTSEVAVQTTDPTSATTQATSTASNTTATTAATDTTAGTDSTATADSTTTSDKQTKAKKPVTPETKSVTTKTTQETIDATLGLNYTLSRRWSFNLSYTYTMSLGPVETSDYYRQQIFFGAEFQF
jgi:hypothetical protein